MSVQVEVDGSRIYLEIPGYDPSACEWLTADEARELALRLLVHVDVLEHREPRSAIEEKSRGNLQLERIADALDKLVELERAQLAIKSLELDLEDKPEDGDAEPPKAAWLVESTEPPFPGAWLCDVERCGRWNQPVQQHCSKCGVRR